MGLSQCRGSSRSKVCGHEGLGGLVGDCEWLVKGWPKGDCQRVKWARFGRRHRGRCAAIRVFSVLGFPRLTARVWCRQVRVRV